MFLYQAVYAANAISAFFALYLRFITVGGSKRSDEAHQECVQRPLLYMYSRRTAMIHKSKGITKQTLCCCRRQQRSRCVIFRRKNFRGAATCESPNILGALLYLKNELYCFKTVHFLIIVKLC